MPRLECRAFVHGLVVVAVLFAADIGAQTDPPVEPAAAARAAETQTREAVAVRQQTQRELDGWAGDKSELLGQYRTLSQQNAWLEQQLQSQTGRVAAIEERRDELLRRLSEADRLQASLADTLEVLQARLERDVARSLPFLPDERRARLSSLRHELQRPEVASAEKLRRLLEAMQIEADYAGTVEVYQDEISVGDTPLHADILRLGRVGLLWRTADGADGGWFDPQTASWLRLPKAEVRRVALAMDMAARRRPMDLVPLPLGRISLGAGDRP